MERATLIVKNFGPLKDIKIEVRPMVTFIGAQASGKSTLAKLISILEDENFRENDDSLFKEELQKYSILSYLNPESYISYSTPVGKLKFEFVYENGKINQNKISEQASAQLTKFIEASSQKIESGIVLNEKDALNNAIDYLGLSDKEEILDFKKKFSQLTKGGLKEILNQKILEHIDNHSDISANDIFKYSKNAFEPEDIYFNSESLYISTERALLHIIAGNTLGLINNKIKIPNHLLILGQEYEKAIQVVNQLNLRIIDKKIEFVREGNHSYIYHQNQRINLFESASGIQTIIPILLLVEYSKTINNFYNYCTVIEEPELNLYPKAQHELIKYLVRNCVADKKSLILTTHSPFILASINNLLIAFKKGQKNPKGTNKIIKKDSWLNSEDFIAYELKNGKAKQISDDKLGMIKDNMIDNVSDFFSDEFDKLLNL